MTAVTTEREASDTRLSAAAALLAAAVIAVGFSMEVGLGDAPESVAGIERWRVVHAPGCG